MNGQSNIRAFARALLNAALQAGTVDAVRNDVVALAAQWDGSPELRAFCVARRPETPDDHAAAVGNLWGDTLTPCVLTLLKQMARWGYLALLRPMAETFLILCDTAQQRHVATIEFACPPTDSELAVLRAKLAKRYNANVEMTFSVKPSLLAGFRMTVGDRKTDASLSGRIARLKNLAKPA